MRRVMGHTEASGESRESACGDGYVKLVCILFAVVEKDVRKPPGKPPVGRAR
jgi:hypothetical protein